MNERKKNGLSGWTLIALVFYVPDNSESELYCYAYASAVDRALAEDPVMGGAASRAVLTEKNMYRRKRLIAGEASGILNWLLEGAQRWTVERLKTPQIITSATDEYRGEMDVIGNFIRERCAQGPGASIRARELFKCYQDWCDDNNEHACSERFLGLRLKELGLEQKRLADGRYWKGIMVKSQLA